MSKRVVPIVPRFEATWYPPGVRCEDLGQCDALIVDHCDLWSGKLIAAGEWLRRETRNYNWATHACVGLDPSHVIQEAGAGAIVSPLSTFDHLLYARVRVTCSMSQRRAALAFAKWTVTFNQGYGFASIVGDGLDDLTGLHVELATYGRMVCSAATARVLERMGLVPDRDPTAVQPANLARYFHLSNPAAGIAYGGSRPMSAADLNEFIARTDRVLHR